MRKFILFILTVCLIVVGVSLVGCSEDDGKGKFTVGGEFTGTNDSKAVFYNADDLHIASNANKDDLEINAYVIDNELKVFADVDLSQVIFGTPGTYPITYSYGTSSVDKTVYIYGTPTIEGQSSLEVAFSKASKEIFNGLTAKDTFGNLLDLQIIDNGGMIDADGSYNVGTFSVKMIAVDRAGQSFIFTRSVEVTEEKNPTLLESYSFDVNEENFSFTLEEADGKNFIGVSFGGKTVPSKMITVSNNTFTVDNDFFYQYLLNESLVADLINGDEYKMNVITNKGKSQADFYLKDNQDVVYDDAAVVEFVKEYYPCFTSIKLGRVNLLNQYQNVTPVYTMKKGGSEVIAENGVFSFTKDGVWTMEINLRGTVISFEVETYYDLGLSNGTIYGESNPFVSNVPADYSLSGYEVYEHGTNVKVLECGNGSAELSDFSKAINALDTSKLYDLKAIAVKDGKLLSQTANVSVVKNGVGILGGKNIVNLTVNNETSTYLRYEQKEIGGRRGVYRWGALQGSSQGSNSKLSFGEAVKPEMKKDYYLTFDIYYTKAAFMYMKFGDVSYQVWNRGSYYASRADDVADNGESSSGLLADESYCGDLIKFFNSSGSEIIRTSKDDDPISAKKGQWITVQFKIDVDSMAIDAGFSVISTSDLGLQEVYISNVRVSALPTMEDSTENVILPDDSEAIFGDIWNI